MVSLSSAKDCAMASRPSTKDWWVLWLLVPTTKNWRLPLASRPSTMDWVLPWLKNPQQRNHDFHGVMTLNKGQRTTVAPSPNNKGLRTAISFKTLNKRLRTAMASSAHYKGLRTAMASSPHNKGLRTATLNKDWELPWLLVLTTKLTAKTSTVQISSSFWELSRSPDLLKILFWPVEMRVSSIYYLIN